MDQEIQLTGNVTVPNSGNLLLTHILRELKEMNERQVRTEERQKGMSDALTDLVHRLMGNGQPGLISDIKTDAKDSATRIGKNEEKITAVEKAMIKYLAYGTGAGAVIMFLINRFFPLVIHP